MKKFAIIIASLATLAGCATQHPNYASRGYASPGDPGEWRVVSVTPVPLGTGARAAASGQAAPTTTGPTVSYSTPATVSPVYVPQPVYTPEPVYVERPRYYYPPISIGLGFNFGRGWGHHRGWGGHIGTRWPYHWR